MSALKPAVDVTPQRGVTNRLTHVTRPVRELAAAAAFYCDALGFRQIRHGATSRTTTDATTRTTTETTVGGTTGEVILRLGSDTISLVQPNPPPAPYPADSCSNDLWFQHLAIVVADMDLAYAHLCARPGWQAISIEGPQQLPASSGGVRAFKFRDPDGHPLELLWFPANQGRAVWRRRRRASSVFLGIDHTALSIRETRRSLRFYAALGWKIRYRSLNRGASQERLDGLPGACVRVLGLRAASLRGPGIELLAYRPPGRTLGSRAQRSPAMARSLADDCTAFAGSASSADRTLTDPDGHRLVVRHQPTYAGARMTNPKPPTRPKFFRNSQKCSSPSPSSNRQNPGKRQN